MNTDPSLLVHPAAQFTATGTPMVYRRRPDGIWQFWMNCVGEWTNRVPTPREAPPANRAVVSWEDTWAEPEEEGVD